METFQLTQEGEDIETAIGLAMTALQSDSIGQPDGIAPLDSNGLVPFANIPPVTSMGVSVLSDESVSGDSITQRDINLENNQQINLLWTANTNVSDTLDNFMPTAVDLTSDQQIGGQKLFNDQFGVNQFITDFNTSTPTVQGFFISLFAPATPNSPDPTVGGVLMQEANPGAGYISQRVQIFDGRNFFRNISGGGSWTAWQQV